MLAVYWTGGVAAEDEAPPPAAGGAAAVPYRAYFNNGAVVSIRNASLPTSNGVGGRIWFSPDGKAMHRIVHDAGKKIYLGYDLEVKPVAKGAETKLKVSFKPLNVSVGELLADNSVTAQFHYMVVPKYPPSQLVDDGATIALDLLSSADGHERVTDYITVASSENILVQKSVAADSQTPVFRSVVRRVLVDVVVTDSKGQPVRGLKSNEFRIQEDGTPQPLRSFNEYSSDKLPELPVLPPLPPNTYLNLSKTAERAPLNIILLDYLNSGAAGQQNLYQTVDNLMKKMPEGSSYAIFVLKDSLTMAHGFSGERKDLENLRKSHIFWPYFSSATEMFRAQLTAQSLESIAKMVSGYNGRKNLIWVASTFHTSMLPGFIAGTRSHDLTRGSGSGSLEDINATSMVNDLTSGQPSPWFQDTQVRLMRAAVDQMVASQIAVYPVRAEGLTSNDFLAQTPEANTLATASSAAPGAKSSGALASMSQAQNEPAMSNADVTLTMNDLADASGGRAYGDNFAIEGIKEAVRDGGNYYTLSYSPSNPKYDGSARHIKVELSDSGYTLNYRRTYLADELASSTPSGTPDEPEVGPTLQHGAPDARELIFTAHMTPLGEPLVATPEQMQAYSSFESGLQQLWEHNPKLLKKSFKAGKTMLPQLSADPVWVQRYSIDYAVLNRQLRQSMRVKGMNLLRLRFVALAYDGEGRKVYGITSQVEDTIDERRLRAADEFGYRVRQTITLPSKESKWLRLLVEDMQGQKLGSMEIYLPALAADSSSEEAAPAQPAAH